MDGGRSGDGADVARGLVELGGRPLLERYVATGVGGLEEEFDQLRASDNPPELTLAAFSDPKNKEKNRYGDVGCWDQSRVRLQDPVAAEDGEESDYVHANFVDGVRWAAEFICTQGPMSSTLDEFWHMVWEQRVASILMLCLCKENGRNKCEQYWKLERGGKLAVECGYSVETVGRDTLILGDYRLVQTLLRLSKAGVDAPRNVIHILHSNWPDKSLPPSSAPMVTLIHKLNEIHGVVTASNQQQPCDSPKLVHCSAGVGRTGTLVAIDQALASLDKGLPVNVPDLVRRLRRQRKSAVQNSQQYVFIYLVLAEYIQANLAAPLPGLDLQPLREFRNRHAHQP